MHFLWPPSCKALRITYTLCYWDIAGTVNTFWIRMDHYFWSELHQNLCLHRFLRGTCILQKFSVSGTVFCVWNTCPLQKFRPKIIFHSNSECVCCMLASYFHYMFLRLSYMWYVSPYGNMPIKKCTSNHAIYRKSGWDIYQEQLFRCLPGTWPESSFIFQSFSILLIINILSILLIPTLIVIPILSLSKVVTFLLDGLLKQFGKTTQ